MNNETLLSQTITYSPAEMMAVRAAQELHDNDVVFVGIGLPNLACNLARLTHAPNLTMIYESGAIGATPERLPVSIGDPALVTDCLSVMSQADIFQCFLQRGLIEVGFLGGAQIDRYGNLNTTVIGDYEAPRVRLPGSGGACEIAMHARKLLIVMRMSRKSFVEQVDFVTSVGHLSHGKAREAFGMPGGGPLKVITDLCVFDFEPALAGREMVVSEIYQGVTQEQIRAASGFEIKFAQAPRTTPTPTAQEIELIRKKLDPEKLYV